MFSPSLFRSSPARRALLLLSFATLPMIAAPPAEERPTAPHPSETTAVNDRELTGRVTELNAKMFAVRGEGQAHPMRFTHGGATQWESAAGQTLTVDFLRLGATVRVGYRTKGKDAEAIKVVLYKAPTATTSEPAAPEPPPPTAPK